MVFVHGDVVVVTDEGAFSRMNNGLLPIVIDHILARIEIKQSVVLGSMYTGDIVVGIA